MIVLMTVVCVLSFWRHLIQTDLKQMVEPTAGVDVKDSSAGGELGSALLVSGSACETLENAESDGDAWFEVYEPL